MEKIVVDTNSEDNQLSDDRLPSFLNGIVTLEKYREWLLKKARAHVKRDRERGNQTAQVANYRRAMDKAVRQSRGLDAYTGKPLDWHLIGTFNNEAAKLGGREYLKKLSYLPTIDHVDDGLGEPNFKICSQITNDCKSHLSHEELIQFCRDVIAFHENLSDGPGNP